MKFLRLVYLKVVLYNYLLLNIKERKGGEKLGYTGKPWGIKKNSIFEMRNGNNFHSSQSHFSPRSHFLFWSLEAHKPIEVQIHPAQFWGNMHVRRAQQNELFSQIKCSTIIKDSFLSNQWYHVLLASKRRRTSYGKKKNPKNSRLSSPNSSDCLTYNIDS